MFQGVDSCSMKKGKAVQGGVVHKDSINSITSLLQLCGAFVLDLYLVWDLYLRDQGDMAVCKNKKKR